MSAEPSLTDTDLDRLADFTAGVLPEEDAAAVAALIATDPAWAGAHAALLAADPMIQQLLRADGASRIEPMPAEVVGRLNAALAAVAGPTTIAAPTARVVPLIDHHRQRRATRKVLGGIAGGVAAAVLAVVGFNLSAGLLANDAAPTAARAPESNSDSGASVTGGAPDRGAVTMVIIASGTDYGTASLGKAAALIAAAPSMPVAPAPQLTGGERPTAVPPSPIPSTVQERADATALARLSDHHALGECLAAVAAAVPGTVEVVDFASFDGAPALVMLIRQQSGSTVVAVGPQCGSDGADIKAIVHL